MDQAEKQLYEAILKLRDVEECRAFFKDICTPLEINDIKDRLVVARLLYSGKFSYREISRETKVSLATITRVARSLTQENNKGYKLIFEREKE
jgi:TrpR-related protein YerC/YecD